MRRDQGGKLHPALALLAILVPMLLPAESVADAAKTAPLADQSAVAGRPEWAVGDRWVYKSSKGRTAVREVLAKEGSRWAVRVGGARWYFSEDLGVQATATNEFEPAIAYYAWPLQVKKNWEVDCLCKKTGFRVKGWPTVQALERITVPAGTFTVYRVYFEDGTGRPPQIHWYAPQVKSHVRWEDHQAGVSWELVEYQVK